MTPHPSHRFTGYLCRGCGAGKDWPIAEQKCKPVRRSHPTPEERASAAARVLAGETVEAVAESIDRAPNAVRAWARAAGWRSRRWTKVEP